MPRIEQLAARPRPGSPTDEAEWRAYRARRRAERAGGAYIASLSFRTVTYKALCAADELGEFYLDLRDPELAVPFGIFHQRFSTNTTPSWERAQPFRFLCHNGEINAIQGNVNWMRAREGNFGTADDELYHPVLDESGSDSAMLDNALEFLVHGGRDIRHARVDAHPAGLGGERGAARRRFATSTATTRACVEPWDGPAGVVFTDGRVVGAALDRNGLRPLRYAVCEDGLVVCSSEAGAVAVEGHGRVRRGKLGPGQMIAVDPERGFEEDDAIKRAARRRSAPVRRLARGGARRRARPARRSTRAGRGPDRRARRLRLHARGADACSCAPIASHAHDPTYSMGDDTALAAARRPRAARSTTTSSSASRRSRTRRSTTCASGS